jgi:3D (Asp-Asp-Asp) domain-containing protein
MKPTRYIITCIITVSICVTLYLSTAQNYRKCESILLKQESIVLELTDTIEILRAENTQHKQDIKALAEQISIIQEQVERKQDKPDRGGERGRIMEVTAYWEGSCGKAPDHPEYGITASGEYVQDGFVAAWLEEYPIGTRLYIPELDKVVTVMDCGGAITEGHLDLYMTTEKECFRFGRQWLEVYEVE